MLVISRRPGEKFMIGDDISVRVTRVDRNGTVRLAIHAPREIPIFREELYKAIQKQGGLRKTANQQKTAPGWIAVANDLPNHDEAVLIYGKENGAVILGFYDEEDRLWRDVFTTIIDQPTHWMPLPESPLCDSAPLRETSLLCQEMEDEP